MKYRELLDLYKKNELDNIRRAEVEADIEKQEAISEYLFENEEIIDFSDPCLQSDISDADMDFDEKRFNKMIKKSIRKAFLKLGIAVAVIVLGLVIAANTALPHVVDAFYYNPAKISGTTSNGIDTNQISLDTAIYTELFTPGYYRYHVGAFEEGWGKYDIQIFQNTSYNGQFRTVYGTIEKGKMTLFDDTVFKLPTQNAFATDEIEGMAGCGTAAAGTAENAREKLQELDESEYYVSYVTLNRVMTYDELVKWSNLSGIVPDWCAVCYQNEKGSYDYHAGDIVGFNFQTSCGEMGYDNEKYPYINYFDMLKTIESFPEDNFSSDVMKEHMLSMLSYMRDNKEFRDMVGCTMAELSINSLIDNIEEYGLNIYGFVVVAQKDRILEISQNENVQYIYTTPLV